MVIALVGPFYNGLNNYITLLDKELTEQGHTVERLGFRTITFDLATIQSNVADLVRSTDWDKYDVINYNYGTYDAEQLIPVLLPPCSLRQILTVNSIRLDLFHKAGAPDIATEVNHQMTCMDGYSFFTAYAQRRLEGTLESTNVPKIVNWHPATHASVSVPRHIQQAILRTWHIDEHRPIIALPGYPSRWKDPAPVLAAAKRCPDIQFVFGGPWWQDRLMCEKEVASNVTMISHELNERELITLIEAGVGLLPYREYPSFQGSGILPNFLIRGVTCIVNRIPPLVEYMKDKPFFVDIDNEDALVSTLRQAIAAPRQQPDLDFSFARHAETLAQFLSTSTRGDQ